MANGWWPPTQGKGEWKFPEKKKPTMQEGDGGQVYMHTYLL